MKVNVMVQGEIGTGKTYCLRTLPHCELDTFVISLEPGLEATLGDYICGAGGPIHYTYIKPTEVSWEALRRYTTLASTLTLANLIKVQDQARAKYDQYQRTLNASENFRCDGCNVSFGDVASWDDSRVLVIDGLSGLTKAAKQMILGARPVIDRAEYQPIQGYIEHYLDCIWSGTRCSTVLIAHLDRRIDELSNISQLTIDTAGPALVRRLVRKPDEIITTERNEKGDYWWDTTWKLNTITKHRRLPESDRLPPDFAQLFTPPFSAS